MARIKLEQVRTRYSDKKRLLDDCIKLQQLLAEDYAPALGHLEEELEKFIKANGTHKKALTTALQKAEVYCGLSPCAPIYMRFLSAEEFSEYGSKGTMFKDVGAGYLHGEYTHRIQWYVIFHAMSKGFTVDVKQTTPSGWNHTPLELLIQINTAGIQLQSSDWPMDAEGNRGFWDALLDRGPGYYPGFDPFVDGITNPEVFCAMLMDKAWLQDKQQSARAQVEFLDQMYPGCYGILNPVCPQLSRIVTMRYEKRCRTDPYKNKNAYVQKKLQQQAPKTYYVKSPLPVKKGDVIGVLEMKLQEEREKGHCFLTTACVQARGLPDDCEELQVLRGFRDGYLRQLPEGPTLIQQYYDLAPRIVERVSREADARRLWEGVYETVREAVGQIQRREPEAALRTYRALVETLAERYLR